LGRNDSKKSEITKDISAFANSAGGTVIFGLREFQDEDRRHLAEKIDIIDGREFSREWLDQVIGQISPRIVGLRITPVRVAAELWQTCYVVEVPQGRTAHQARDLRYYRRYNFESVPMGDHEIRDVMNRSDHPCLDFTVQVQSTRHGTVKILSRFQNTGRVIAMHYKLRVLVPTVVASAKLWKDDLLLQEVEGFKYWRVSLGNANLHPLFPGDDVIHDLEIPHTFHDVPEPTTDFLVCTLYADEMPAQIRRIPLASATGRWT
jgi:hypothetical protein